MYTDSSTTDQFPKTLLIHNTKGGAVWQVYHVQAEHEAEKLSSNADKNGFQYRELVDHTNEEETFPDWRETPGGKEIIQP